MSQIPSQPPATRSPTETPVASSPANIKPASMAGASNSTPPPAGTGGAPAQQAFLQLPSTSILPQLAKDIGVGDIIQFMVRGRTPEGMGLLYMMGQLVQAKIPDHVNQGDRVHAQIAVEGERIIFKILEVQSKTGTTVTPQYENPVQVLMSMPDTISAKVEEALHKLAPFIPDSSLKIPNALPHSSAPIPTATNTGTVPVEIKALLQTLKEILPQGVNILTSGPDLFSELQKIATPSSTNAIKDLQVKLTSLLEKYTPPRETRFLTSLIDQLQNLSSTLQENLPSSTGKASLFIDRIMRALEQEIDRDVPSAEGSSKTRYMDTLKVTFAKLKELNTNKTELNSENITKLLQHIEKNSTESGLINNNTPNSLPPQLHRELRALLSSVEQFTATQEMMQRLEPVLQSLRQPELLLFPFIFQGLFSFGELVVDPDAHRHSPKNQPDNNSAGDNENNENSKQETDSQNSDNNALWPVLNYHAQLPLPNLGVVHIGSLQSKEEIQLHLQLEDDEKADFIRSQLVDLRSSLQSIGFSKIDVISESELESAIVPEKQIEVRA